VDHAGDVTVLRRSGELTVLLWTAPSGARRLAGMVPFGAPSFYRGLPLLALQSCAPILRSGCEQGALHALLEWFRADGEGAALLVFRALARNGAVYRALAEVARQREQLVLAATAADGSRTLLVSDRKWNELSTATLPLLRWAKRGTARLLYGSLDL